MSYTLVIVESPSKCKIIEKNIKYIPGLFKLFDEGIVNCRDHVVRMLQAIANGQPNCLPVTNIEITIDEEGRKYKPYFSKILYGIPAEEFLKDIMANVVSDDNSDNDKARRKFEEILQKAKKEYDRYNNVDDDDDEEDNNDTTGVDFSDIGL